MVHHWRPLQVWLLMQIAWGCKAHGMGREEDLPPFSCSRFWLHLPRNQSRLQTTTLAKSHLRLQQI